MKILGIGTDIVEIGRVRNARFLDRVAEYICTEDELVFRDTSRNRVQFIASRLALKEAIIKAFPYKIGYQHIVLKPAEKGLQAHCVRREDREYTVHVSLSHEFAYTVATALVCDLR